MSHRTIGGMLSALLFSCAEPAAPDAPDPVSMVPDIPTASCAGADHAWVPLDQTGQSLAAERDEDLSLTAAGLQLLLETFDIAGITPTFDVAVYQSRYSTQDRGAPIEASGWFAHPTTPGEYPLLLWMHPTAGFSPPCGPSARGIEGAIFPIVFASLGYVVAAPDYIGMNGWAEPSSPDLHPYIVAEPTAVASLDSARALLDEASRSGWPAQPDPSRTVLYGASEGGFAALVADRYAEALAPELTPAVVMAAVPPTDLLELAIRGTAELNDTTSGLAAILTTMRQWYDAPPLDDVLQPDFAANVEDLLEESCSDFSYGDPTTVTEIFQPAFVDALQAGDGPSLEPWQCILEESSPRRMPVQGHSDAVIALVTSEADDLTWAPPVHDDIVGWCDEGRQVVHKQCATLDHSSAGVATLPWQLETIAGLLDGTVVPECTVAPPEPCD